MGILALICALLLLILIPNDIWLFLLYVGVVLAVGYVGFFALMAYIGGL